MSVVTLSPRPAALRRPRLSRRCALGLGVILFLVLLGLEMAVLPDAWQRPRAASSTARLDPRLVVRAHTVPLAGALAGGVTLTGTLYPALPGPNTLRLTLREARGALPVRPVGSLHLMVTMPGMPMPPIRATLAARAGGYSGTMLLPMFGRYKASVVAVGPGHLYAGTFPLSLSLPGL